MQRRGRERVERVAQRGLEPGVHLDDVHVRHPRREVLGERGRGERAEELRAAVRERHVEAELA